MRFSVIMIDGGFREKIYGAKYFSDQDFPEDQYEIIWVDYYDSPHKELVQYPKVNVVTLNRTDEYHSSYCFNKGIKEAQGEIIILPDADQIVKSNFLTHVWKLHQKYENLVVYGYRYDEPQQDVLQSHDFKELDDKCILKNPINYGGCLTVRKKLLLKMNGYEQHGIFRTGFHANGMLMYSRFKNMGLAVQWEPLLRLYHPWHPFTLSDSVEYKSQHKVIRWIQSNLFWKSIEGIDPANNLVPPKGLKKILDEQLALLNENIKKEGKISSMTEFPQKTTQPLRYIEKQPQKRNFLNRIKESLFKVIKNR